MPFRYAESGTLLGQLQRGRGLGARRASAETAGDLVFECVARDARWDPGSEARDEYLAVLVLESALPLDPVREHLFGAGGPAPLRDVELALRVLGRLVELGREDAVPLLRRYAAEGRHWEAAIAAVRDWKAEGRWDGLDRDVLARPDVEGDRLAAAISAGGPWLMWADATPRLREAVDRLMETRRVLPTREPIQRLSSAELLGRITADGRAYPRELLVLAGRGDLVVLDLAEDARLRAAGAIPNIGEALRCIGTPAVVRAREWAAEGDEALTPLAVGVLAAAGERSDAEVLAGAFARAAEAGDWAALEDPAKGLGRLGVLEAGEMLAEAWAESVSSGVRAALLSGLAGCLPESFDGFAVEGLDDCESGVQEVACDRVALTGEVVARLREWQAGPDLWDRRWLAAMRLAAGGV